MSKSTTSLGENVSSGGLRSDPCFHDWEVGSTEVATVFHPDYLVYHGIYSLDSMITFVNGSFEIKGSNSKGNQEKFSFQWQVDDVVNIKSNWIGRYDAAMVYIDVNSSKVNAENMDVTPGIEELKFALVEPDWYEKQEAILALDERYKMLWKTLHDTDMEIDELGHCIESLSKKYFPDFDQPFEDVVYPKGDSDAVSISRTDVDLLQPDKFVNDTIIDFYIKYLKNKIQPEERHKFHFFNSFFFRKLADLDKDPASAFAGKAAFQRVRKWTRKINLFEKDYIFIPVNFNYHWSLIVICHPGEVAKLQDEDVEKLDKVPCILHMDSIRGSHTGLKGLMQSYLWEEWKEKLMETSEEISSRFSNLRFVSLELPQQQNASDCGLFLLHYVERFLEDAPASFSPFKITKVAKFLSMDWFPPFEASLKRGVVERLIYDLVDACSAKPSPSDDGGRHSRSDCQNNNNDHENVVELLSEKCSPLNLHVNLPNSSAVIGIQMAQLPTPSLRSSHYMNEPGLVLEEILEPGAGAGSYFGSHYQAFDQTMALNGFNSDMPSIEEVEASRQRVYPPMEDGFQPPAGSTPEGCAFSYSTDTVGPAWVDDAEHRNLPQEIGSVSVNSLEGLDEKGQVIEEGSLKDQMVDRSSVLTENVNCLTECFNPEPNDMVDTLHLDTGSHVSCTNNLGVPHHNHNLVESDGKDCGNLQLINADSVSELDVDHPSKKMRLTHVEGDEHRGSLSDDLQL